MCVCWSFRDLEGSPKRPRSPNNVHYINIPDQLRWQEGGIRGGGGGGSGGVTDTCGHHCFLMSLMSSLQPIQLWRRGRQRRWPPRSSNSTDQGITTITTTNTTPPSIHPSHSLASYSSPLGLNSKRSAEFGIFTHFRSGIIDSSIGRSPESESM